MPQPIIVEDLFELGDWDIQTHDEHITIDNYYKNYDQIVDTFEHMPVEAWKMSQWTRNWKDYYDCRPAFNNWEPDISATGGGNDEFQQYYLHPEAARLVNGTLQLKPLFDEGDLRDDIDLYNYGCINNWNNGCYSKGSMHWNKGKLHYVNNKPIPVGGKRTKPFISTKLVSKKTFGYGKLTVEFKLPKGNFLWPAIWMLPATKKIWPIGGEIDLMESMGNSPEMGYAMN